MINYDNQINEKYGEAVLKLTVNETPIKNKTKHWRYYE